MPELEVIEDSVVLSFSISASQNRERFVKCIQEEKKSVSKIESSFNFIEIGYLFDPKGRDTTDEEDELLAHLIRDAWDGWLHYRYPARRFVVKVLSAEMVGSTVGVHFYQQR